MHFNCVLLIFMLHWCALYQLWAVCCLMTPVYITELFNPLSSTMHHLLCSTDCKNVHVPRSHNASVSRVLNDRTISLEWPDSIHSCLTSYSLTLFSTKCKYYRYTTLQCMSHLGSTKCKICSYFDVIEKRGRVFEITNCVQQKCDG